MGFKFYYSGGDEMSVARFSFECDQYTHRRLDMMIVGYMRVHGDWALGTEIRRESPCCRQLRLMTWPLPFLKRILT